jgi:hypothetical protein
MTHLDFDVEEDDDITTFAQLAPAVKLALPALLERNRQWSSRSHATARVWRVAHGAGLLFDIANVAENFIEGDQHAGLVGEALGAGEAGGQPCVYRRAYLHTWLEERAAAEAARVATPRASLAHAGDRDDGRGGKRARHE